MQINRTIYQDRWLVLSMFIEPKIQKAGGPTGAAAAFSHRGPFPIGVCGFASTSIEMLVDRAAGRLPRGYEDNRYV